MKIETAKLERLKISEVDRLDPISVITEDIAPGQGKIIIECYGKSWSSYWNAMGKDRTIAQFFCSCDEDYISKNLSGTPSSVEDMDGFATVLKKQIIQNRLDGDVDKDTAREQYDEADTADPHNDQSLMHDILGDEWWYHIPSKPNPDYEYLCRIINTVKAALRKQIT